MLDFCFGKAKEKDKKFKPGHTDVAVLGDIQVVLVEVSSRALDSRCKTEKKAQG